MNIPTNHQIITHQGVPVAVVVPYDEYTTTFLGEEKKLTVPHEVASRVLKEQLSPIRAWREYLELTQAEMAARMEVSQSAFAQMEASDRTLRISTLKKVASAMGITPDQLKW